MLKNNKGITLIALVVTIIVLLILAGVTIAMLTGTNGILTQASKAGSTTEISEAKEIARMDVSALISQYYEARYVNNANSTDLGGADDTQPGAYVKANLTSKAGYYTVEADKTIELIATEEDGTAITGTIADDGAITWTDEQ